MLKQEKKEDIQLSPMTNTTTPQHSQQNLKSNTTKNAMKNFDYTMIADRLRKVNWSSDIYLNGVVEPVN